MGDLKFFLKFTQRALGMLLGLAVFLNGATSKGETWKVITLDWPPYTDEHLPNKGVAAKALSETLKSVGITVEFVFMPWSRGIYEVKKPEYVGIFPSWTATGFKGARLSPSLFQSPIGFVFPSKAPVAWKTLQDLKGLRIGIVQDYHYPVEFVALGEKKFFKFFSEGTDEQNLFKVAYQRVDATIIDLVNARYIINTHPEDLKKLLTVDPKVYKNADLFIAMKDDAHFNGHFQKLKTALSKVSSQKIIDAEIKDLVK